MNLFDLGMRIVGDMQQLSVDGLGANYSESPHWRFVMDNSVPHALPAFMELLNLLTDSIRQNAQEFVNSCVRGEAIAALTFLRSCCRFIQIQSGFVVVLLIVLFVLGQFVFRRALARVVVIKRAVLEIALSLTAEQLQELQHRAEDGKAYVARARARVAGAVDAQNDPEMNADGCVA